MRFHRFLLLGLLLLSGCIPILLDDSCGPTTREMRVGAPITDGAGTRIGRVEMVLQENRDDPGKRSFSASVMGPGYGNPGPLSLHIQRVRLLAADGTLLRDFAFRHGNEHEIIRIEGENPIDKEEFDRFKRLFRASEVAAEIQSDVPGLERLRIPLRLIHEGNWSRASCS